MCSFCFHLCERCRETGAVFIHQRLDRVLYTVRNAAARIGGAGHGLDILLRFTLYQNNLRKGLAPELVEKTPVLNLIPKTGSLFVAKDLNLSDFKIGIKRNEHFDETGIPLASGARDIGYRSPAGGGPVVLIR